jgi:hypothetical protein
MGSVVVHPHAGIGSSLEIDPFIIVTTVMM